MQKAHVAILSFVAGIVALPVSCVAYLAGIELVEQYQVKSRLRDLPDVAILDLRGDFDVGISATVRSNDSPVMAFGAITDRDFLHANWVSLERIGQFSLWRVGCHATPGLIRQSWAIAGVGIEHDSPVGRRFDPPVADLPDALRRSREILSAVRTLPPCSQWRHDLPLSVCVSSAGITPVEVHEELRSDACPGARHAE